MAREDESAILEEAYRIGTEVIASMKKRTTDKMVLDLFEDYEQPIRQVIEETVLMTITNFNLKKPIDIYDEIEKKAEEITRKEMKQLFPVGMGFTQARMDRFRAEFTAKKSYHIQRLLELNNAQ